jgi:hypothetical protein
VEERQQEEGGGVGEVAGQVGGAHPGEAHEPVVEADQPLGPAPPEAEPLLAVEGEGGEAEVAPQEVGVQALEAGGEFGAQVLQVLAETDEGGGEGPGIGGRLDDTRGGEQRRGHPPVDAGEAGGLGLGLLGARRRLALWLRRLGVQGRHHRGEQALAFGIDGLGVGWGIGAGEILGDDELGTLALGEVLPGRGPRQRDGVTPQDADAGRRRDHHPAALGRGSIHALRCRLRRRRFRLRLPRLRLRRGARPLLLAHELLQRAEARPCRPLDPALALRSGHRRVHHRAELEHVGSAQATRTQRPIELRAQREEPPEPRPPARPPLRDPDLLAHEVDGAGVAERAIELTLPQGGEPARQLALEARCSVGQPPQIAIEASGRPQRRRRREHGPRAPGRARERPALPAALHPRPGHDTTPSRPERHEALGTSRGRQRS